MKEVWAIAKLTFKEAVRNRILYLLVVFAVILVSSSWVIGKLTIGDEMKIIKDMGISTIHFFGILITIFIGIGLIFREMEKRTVYLILSKPVRRSQFLLGKFAGLALTLFVVLCALVFIFYAVLFLKGGAETRILLAFYFIYLEWLLVAAIAIVFSSFSTPLLSTILTLTSFFAGHLTQSLLLLQSRVHSEFGKLILSMLYYLLPNLELLNVRAEVVHRLPLAPHLVPEATLYWALYLSALLLFAMFVFQKKDFT